MAPKVLLVYPEMPLTYWSLRYALPVIGKKALFPPLGLQTVAAMLPADFELTLIDMNVEPLTESAVAGSDLVFTSSMIVQKDSLEEVIRLCNALGKPVVAGGPYPTSCHEEIRGVDHFVLNEAEITLPPFLRDLALGRAKPLYTSTDKPDLGLSPPPRFDLVRGEHYAHMALQYSRGCPHSCEFCDIIELFGRRPRTKSPAQLLRELEVLYQGGWRGSLFLVDDNFIGNRKEVKALLPQLIAWQRERGHPFTLFTEASLDLASDDELMDLMVAAGFDMVFMGIETPDLATLDAAGKQQNLKHDMLSSVRKIQGKGMEVAGGFIVGFDSDPEDIFDRQIRFIQEAAIPTAMVGLLTALPCTQLHKRLQAEGRLTLASSGGSNTHDLRLNFVPRMDERKLLDGYKRILSEIYDPDRYFQRCLRLLKALDRPRIAPRRIRLADLRAFCKSLLIQTFSRYSWAYWKFLAKGFSARPGMLAETVTMAVKGHHFFKITRNAMALDHFKGTLDRVARSFEAGTGDLGAGADPDQFAQWKARRDLALAQMWIRYGKLSKDFRGYADGAVARFQATLGELAARVNPPPAPGGRKSGQRDRILR
ncbi:MAG: radical SAM protein [Holophaga sp.]|nr:radical SAM protein [Holophaga sp.]